MSEIKQYKCPYCSAELTFNADKQLFACEYCLGEFTEEELEQNNKDEEETSVNKEESEEFENGTNLYSCPSCGAEIMSDGNTAATFCYYCHNPVILKGNVSGDYRPSKVLPFEFGKDKSIEIFNNWAKKKFFVDKGFLADKQMEKLTGLYVPFWVADAKTSGHLDGIGKKIRTWTAGGYDYEETSEFKVVRDANIEYKGLPADGSQKIEDALMEAIEPFDYSKTKDFKMAYLSGYLADKYDVSKEQVFPRMKKRMEEANDKALRADTNYTILEAVANTKIKKVDWQYMLLPVWFMSYNYKGEMLEYAVNGQSGKIAGKLPLNKAKLLLVCAIIVVVCTLLGLLGGLLIW